MSSVRITAIPPGFAPERIRKQWVGVELPLASKKEIAQNPPSGFGIGSDNTSGYLVLRDNAIEALRQAGKKEAADFWGSLRYGRFLQFKKEVCEMVV